MYLTLPLHRALQQRPDAIMTICGNRVRTTTEVADRVARLAGALRGIDVHEGDRVGMLALNSDRYHEFFLGSWWAGAVAHPINTRWSVPEIAYAINDSGTEVLFVDDTYVSVAAQLRELCPRLRTVVYCGDETTPAGTLGYEDLIADAAPVPDVRQGGDILALLLYTGGTTGRPKGVMISHRGLFMSLLGTHAVNLASQNGGITLHTAPLFHIAAISSWHTQNILGGTHVFLPSFTAGAFLEAVQRYRVTTCILIPSMMQMICDDPAIDSHDVSSLRRITCGGSAFSDGLRRRAMKAFPTAGFGQGYGMTETAVLTILDPGESPEQRATGRTVAHVELEIHDPAGNSVPLGEIGEVVTRGDHVMMGYWNRPEETAEALRGGWMHTGDLGYLDKDGYLYIVDRIKDMILTGGENVYSAEVENTIATHPAVSSCAVIGLPDPRWGERVHAVIVLKPGSVATVEEIQAHTRKFIAGYKTPRSIEFVTTLPMSAAGKILKRDLRTTRTTAPTQVSQPE
ncbi:long-chain-fatty-acid--CoA ligase [Rhodococcus opacus]|uniref:long-chain-fatty-acid--CoA ligase n=1 Tax=Rhodococcus opacus TaxID=37919 RepID=UPI001C4645D2|nr:long-chain-fatty-acid--CoA ligase [Rhodococcus opacus]MBV6754867.1 long-chain-fatty-acid--CoA ligase [Rhodococcus opacus]